MALIDTRTVDKISRLARLGLKPAELKQAAAKLAEVLEHFSSLQKIDLTHVPTSDDVTGLSNVSRSDVPKVDLLCAPANLIERIPEVAQHQVKVKAVFSE